jgi:hypothetical protein
MEDREARAIYGVDFHSHWTREQFEERLDFFQRVCSLQSDLARARILNEPLPEDTLEKVTDLIRERGEKSHLIPSYPSGIYMNLHSTLAEVQREVFYK